LQLQRPVHHRVCRRSCFFRGVREAVEEVVTRLTSLFLQYKSNIEECFYRYGRDPSHMHHYMFEIGSMIIDATKKGNCSRFMNHSCEPNAVCEKWYVPKTPCAIDRIGFFAKRDIELGEEITFDYQFENYGLVFLLLPCRH
ncbi:SET domain protein, partial [Ancylostoma ceylanicum]